MKIKKSSYVSLTAILGLFLCLPSFALGKAEPVEHLTLTSIKAETLAENQYIQGKVYMTNIENVDRYKKLLLRIILKYEMYFRDNLRFLAEHPRETALFLDSGLFGSLSIDYSDRLDYIQKNGIACLGATAYLSGDALKMIMHNSTVFQVIRVEEDLPNSKNDMTA